ncbi:hypothetical protein [Nocardia sp. NPDC004860]|uniref:hypothetical protein n=1 Tax=Nocardia sp. NPDC004860 TaxID=3154557 RepID=UPI0033A092BB
MPDTRSKPTDPVRLEIVELLDMIPGLIDLPDFEIVEGSRMALDRSATTLIDLPWMVNHFLMAASEHLRTLHLIMRPVHRTLLMPRVASYPIMRAAMEASSQALWVVGAEEQRTRFLRILQLEKSEMDYNWRYVAALTEEVPTDGPGGRSRNERIRREAAPKKKRRWKRMQDLADAFGIEQTEFENGCPGYGEIIRESVNEQGLDGRFCYAIWMYVSGICHSSASRVFAGSRNIRSEDAESELTSVYTEVDPKLVRDALQIALRLQISALALTKEFSNDQAESQGDREAPEQAG